MPSVSVALATYNGEKFIRKQLESLAAQTLLPTELVVCDEASSDGTVAAIEDFAAKSPFPVHIHRNPERLGYRRNFMKTAEMCQGELIAFCDQDDIWHPEKLQVMAAFFADPSMMLAFHNARLVDANGNPFGKIREQGYATQVFEPMAFTPWAFPQGFTMVFRRELLALSPLQHLSLDYTLAGEMLAHDQWIYLLATIFGRIADVAELLADYRQHGSNLYGIRHTTKTRRERLNEKFDKFSNFLHYAAACDRIVDILDAAAQLPLPSNFPERRTAAAARFRELARLYRHRGIAYAAASPIGRLRSWLALARAGGYGKHQAWSFGQNELVRDFVLGVCLGKLRRRTGADPVRDWSLTVNHPL